VNVFSSVILPSDLCLAYSDRPRNGVVFRHCILFGAERPSPPYFDYNGTTSDRYELGGFASDAVGIGVYYRIRVPPLYKLVLIGSCIYSTDQLVTNRVDRYLSASTNFPLDLVQRFAYVGMLSIWLWAVWRWGKSSTPPPDLVSQATYDELSPQIHDRLRELNDKLPN